MFTRSVAGVVVGLGMVGSLAAQQPATFTRYRTKWSESVAIPHPEDRVARAASGDAPAPQSGVVPAARFAAITRTERYTLVQADSSVPASPAPTPVPVVVAEPSPESLPPTAGPTASLVTPPGRYWVNTEWLYWTASGQRMPPLVTTAVPGTPQGIAGTLGGSATQTVFPTGRVNDDWRNGFRLRAGLWLGPDQRLGVEGDFFVLATSRQGFAAGSPGVQILSRPFTNATAGSPDVYPVSFPGMANGAVVADSRSDLIGGGVSLVRTARSTPAGRFDWLLGYRYLSLQDDLTVGSDVTATAFAGTPTVRAVDQFRTTNAFHGGLVGLNWEHRWSSWFFGVRSSVALGVTHGVATIDGQSAVAEPSGAVTPYPGGLLAQPTNSGRFTGNHFAVVPEVGVRLGAQVTERLRAHVGYNYLYWSSVLRPGDQIDLRVNPNLIAPTQPLTGPALPTYSPQRTGYWAQGVSLGLEFRF